MFNIVYYRSLLRYAKNINHRFMATKKEDVCTHTGQKWDSDDYRMARFMHAPKVVNPNWAVKLLQKIKPTPVIGRKVFCDGGSSTEGHPRIYINLDAPGPQFCMYCNRSFIQAFQKPDPCK
ncbi:hypothetical protein PYW08_015310 [Mythimna loreyi]|uniref:Uncharacterized protein n=1 Tax=Mythimna loreyi TaxID=667449 RepID=A0ACC2QWA3_9NEOP|nr:hypothetical protein PYW08_015310 [Mythimna loreyi]